MDDNDNNFLFLGDESFLSLPVRFLSVERIMWLLSLSTILVTVVGVFVLGAATTVEFVVAAGLLCKPGKT